MSREIWTLVKQREVYHRSFTHYPHCYATKRVEKWQSIHLSHQPGCVVKRTTLFMMVHQVLACGLNAQLTILFPLFRRWLLVTQGTGRGTSVMLTTLTVTDVASRVSTISTRTGMSRYSHKIMTSLTYKMIKTNLTSSQKSCISSEVKKRTTCRLRLKYL